MTNLDLSGVRLSSLFSPVTTLRRQGREFTAVCPFHDDTRPSCNINDEKGVYHCFSCGASGNAITFLTKMYNLSSKEALDKLGLGSCKLNKKKLPKLKIEAQTHARGVEQRKSEEDLTLLRSEALDFLKSLKYCEDRGHPYLTKKQIRAHKVFILPKGRTFKNLPEDSLIIPIYNETGQLLSLQAIDETGRKTFLKGAKRGGGFFSIGDESPYTILCEGFSSGGSLHEATGHQIIICFGATNISAVASRLRKLRPNKPLIVCADNDKAGLAAAKATGLKYMYPRFDDAGVERFRRLVGKPAGSPSDFNDYMNIYGLGELKQCLMKI